MNGSIPASGAGEIDSPSLDERIAAFKAGARAFTGKETRVAALLFAQRKTNREAALELGNSPRTIEIHRGRIMKKTGARSAAEAVYFYKLSMTEVVGKTKPEIVYETLLSRLSPREQEVLPWVLEGKRSNQIGKVLGINKRTVEVHIGRIFKAANIYSRTELIARCTPPIEKDASTATPTPSAPKAQSGAPETHAATLTHDN